MKKLLLMLMLLFTISINIYAAEVYIYKTTGFAIKQVVNGRWTNWSDWQESDMYVTINFDTDVVKIFSPETQVYKITEYVRKYTDESDGQQIEFRFIDQDGDRGSMRLRIEKNGNSQIYIEFADVMWVYNVRRVQQ